MWFLLFACSATLKVDDSAGQEADADTDADTDTDVGTGPDTGPGEVFEPTTPSLVADLSGTSWSAAEGYWFGSEDFSSVRGELPIDATTSESFTLQTEGDIHHAGSFPVTNVDYVQQVSQAGDAFHYLVSSPVGVRLIVEGFADGDKLFAHLEGTAHLTDSVGGGTKDLVGLTVETWSVR